MHTNELVKLRENNRITEDHAKLLGLGSHPPTAINKSSIDLSLWYTLIRNISSLKRTKWKILERKPLRAGQTLPQHDATRLKALRNSLVHQSFPRLENEEFDRIWRELSAVLLRRCRISQDDIDAYMNQQSFDPAQVMSNFIALQQQVQRDFQAHCDAEKTRNQQ